MALFKNYDPGQIIIVFNGIQLVGYADGSFVKVARDEDAFLDTVGAGGDVVRVRNHNRKGTITCTLQSASPSNDLLSVTQILDERTGVAYGPVMVKDLNGTTLAAGANAWIVKPADIEYGAEHTNREWMIRVAELEMLVGGELV